MIKKLLLFVVMLASLALPATVRGGVIKLTASDFQTIDNTDWIEFNSSGSNVNNKKIKAETADFTIIAYFGCNKVGNDRKLILNNAASYFAICNNKNRVVIEKIEISIGAQHKLGTSAYYDGYLAKDYSIYTYNEDINNISDVCLNANSFTALKNSLSDTNTHKLINEKETFSINVDKEYFVLGPVSTSINMKGYADINSITLYYTESGGPNEEDPEIQVNGLSSDIYVGETYPFSLSPAPNADGYTFTVTPKTSACSPSDVTITDNADGTYSLTSDKEGDYEIRFSGKTNDEKTVEKTIQITVKGPQVLTFPNLGNDQILRLTKDKPETLTLSHNANSDGFKFTVDPEIEDNFTFKPGLNDSYYVTAKKSGTYNVTVSGKTSANIPIIGSFTTVVTDPQQTTPIALTFEGLPETCTVGETYNFTVAQNILVSDFSYTVTNKTNGTSAQNDVTLNKNGDNYSLSATKAGEYEIKIVGKTTDGTGAEGSFTIVVTDQQQTTPIILTFEGLPETCTVGETCNFTVAQNLLVSDFSYTITNKASGASAQNDVTLNKNGNNYSLSATKAGEYEIKVVGKTADGTDAEGSFTITVVASQTPDPIEELTFPGLGADKTLNVVAGTSEILRIEPAPTSNLQYEFVFDPVAEWEDINASKSWDEDYYRINANKAGEWNVKVYGNDDTTTVLGTFRVKVTAAPVELENSKVEPKVNVPYEITFKTYVNEDGYTITPATSDDAENVTIESTSDRRKFNITASEPGTYTFNVAGKEMNQGYDIEGSFTLTFYGDLKISNLPSNDHFPNALGVIYEGSGSNEFNVEPAIQSPTITIKPENNVNPDDKGLEYNLDDGIYHFIPNTQGAYTVTISGSTWQGWQYKNEFTVVVVDKREVDFEFNTDYFEVNSGNVPFTLNPDDVNFKNSLSIKDESGNSTDNVDLVFSNTDGYSIIPQKAGNYTIALEYYLGYTYYTGEKQLVVEEQENFPESIEPFQHLHNDGYDTKNKVHLMSNYEIEEFANHRHVAKIDVDPILDSDWKEKYEWNEKVHGVNEDSHQLYHGIYVGKPTAEIDDNNKLTLCANVPGDYSITITTKKGNVYNYTAKIQPVLNNDKHVFALQHSKFENDQYTFSVVDDERGDVKFWAPHWGTVYCYIDRGTAAQANNYQPQGIQLVNVNSEGKPVYEEEYVLEPVTGNTLDLRGAQSIYLAQKVNGVMSEVVPATIVTGKDVVTGVDEVGVDSEAAGKYYTLEGIEVSELQSGHIYIHVVNGKSNVIVVK